MLKAISAKVLELKCCQIQEYNNEKVINFDARILINLKSSRQKMFNKTENVKQNKTFVSFIRTITNNFFLQKLQKNSRRISNNNCFGKFIAIKNKSFYHKTV